MKVLYLLLLIPLCQGLPQCTSPNNVRVSTNGDEKNMWLDINWSQVKNDDKEDPVLGYKVKMFEIEPKVNYEYHENVDGKLEASPKYEIPNFNINEETGDLKVEIDVPANKTDATIKELKVGVTYEVGVHAYTKKCEGELTKKMRIKLEPAKKN